MKANRLYIFSLCAIAGLSLYACDDDSSKSCEKSSECGDTSEWKCDIDSNTCVRLFPEHCKNGKTDGGETDADCGGTCADANAKQKLKCGLGKVCKVNGDCGSGKCEAGKCVTAGCNDLGACDDTSLTCDRATMTCISCSDGTKNGDETDIDCGGSKCSPCVAGKVCKTNGDCETGLCKDDGKCSDQKAVDAKTDDLIINEFMANSDGTTDVTKAKTFPYNGHAKQCKFVEIINVSENRVIVDDCHLLVQKLDADDNPVEGKESLTQLEGTISSKGVIVVTEKGCLDIAYAPGTVVLTLANASNVTKKDPYRAKVYCGKEEGTDSALVIIPAADAGYSMNRPEDMKLLTSETNQAMVIHTSAKGAFSFSYASPSYCANGGLFSQDCKTACGDGALNSDETDVDCGGNFCGPCAVGKNCGKPTDCDTNLCDGGKCVAPKCDEKTKCEGELVCNLESGKCEGCGDGVLNGDETDTDCGGSCSTKCKKEQKCKAGTDCETGQCGSDGKCAGDKPNAATVDDLVINEVMGSPKSGMPFSTQETVTQCEFVEIVNKTDNPLSLENLKLNLKKDGDASAKEIEIKDMIIAGKSAGVVGECEVKLGPDDVSYKKVSLGMTNKYAYELWLSSSDKEGEHVTRAEKSTATGESQSRHPDITGTSLEFGTATPGYCNNGGLFSQNCAVDCGNGTETCGGKCPEKCASGLHCNGNDDCASGTCEGNVCTGQSIESANLSDLTINEVMGSPKTGDKFALQTETAQCEFIEIVNIADHTVSVDGISVKLAKDKAEISETADITIELTGNVPAKTALVLSKEAIPDKAGNETAQDFVWKSASFGKGITNGSPYAIWLSKGEETSGLVIRNALGTANGKSQNRSVDMGTTENETLVFHDTVSTNSENKYLNSPGYCANGKNFSEGCE
ncbi:MAG: hypothetical protein IJU23_07400 [Proteobacteria bacterium]|nr:hypothetical protein [Pseudomonadota bacterium]